MLYNPGGIVLSDIQQIALTNLEYFYIWVPGCRALVAPPQQHLDSRSIQRRIRNGAITDPRPERTLNGAAYSNLRFKHLEYKLTYACPSQGAMWGCARACDHVRAALPLYIGLSVTCSLQVHVKFMPHPS